jgi:hypothetical protein
MEPNNHFEGHRLNDGLLYHRRNRIVSGYQSANSLLQIVRTRCVFRAADDIILADEPATSACGVGKPFSDTRANPSGHRFTDTRQNDPEGSPTEEID